MSLTPSRVGRLVVVGLALFSVVHCFTTFVSLVVDLLWVVCTRARTCERSQIAGVGTPLSGASL